MEPITLIFLSGMVSGVIIGDAFDPIGIDDNDHVIKECSTKTTKSKIYDKELKDYISNEFVEETCTSRYIPPERPILDAISGKTHRKLTH
tara:strand:- start:318 stop:587 length:270 start_codon:yes stop_codon:yes gene_type:complete